MPEEEPLNLDDNDESEPLAVALESVLPVHGDADMTELKSAEVGGLTPDHEPRSWLHEEAKKPKGPGMFIAAVITAVILVLGVGGWATYALWYQNPDKIVMDAVANAMTAKTVAFSGTLSATDTADGSSTYIVNGSAGYKEGAQGSLKLNAKAKGAEDFNVEIDGVRSPDGDNYVKVGNLATIYQMVKDEIDKNFAEKPSKSSQALMQTVYTNLFDPIVKRVDGKWVKFDANDMKKISADSADSYDCATKSLEALGTDVNKLLELGNLYQNNKFIIIKKSLGTRTSNVGYEVTIDNKLYNQFVTALKSTKIYKDIAACMPSGDKTLESTFAKSDKPMPSVELWIDRWTHQLTGIHSTTNDEVDGVKTTYVSDISTKFNEAVSIGIPSNALSFNDAFPEIEQFFGNSNVGASVIKGLI